MLFPNNATSSLIWNKRSSRLLSRFYSFQSRTRIHPEVQHAISTNRPVVALESTIVAHGMPYPQNYQVALEVESIVRSKVNYLTTQTRPELLRLVTLVNFFTTKMAAFLMLLCIDCNSFYRVPYQLPLLSKMGFTALACPLTNCTI